MVKKLLICLFMIAMLAGCTDPVGGDYLFEQIDELEKSLNQPEIDWKYVEGRSKELRKLYDDNKWKLQLIGDEREYEGIKENIDIFIATIDEKDVTQAKMELATIKSILEDIYSL